MSKPQKPMPARSATKVITRVKVRQPVRLARRVLMHRTPARLLVRLARKVHTTRRPDNLSAQTAMPVNTLTQRATPQMPAKLVRRAIIRQPVRQHVRLALKVCLPQAMATPLVRFARKAHIIPQRASLFAQTVLPVHTLTQQATQQTLAHSAPKVTILQRVLQPVRFARPVITTPPKVTQAA